METITFRCKIITPMFLSSGVHDQKPEIRAASIKGALRFWWRAMHADLELAYGDSGANRGIRAAEGKLFGIVRGDDAQQSNVSITCSLNNLSYCMPPNHLKYFAFGPTEQGGGNRAIEPGTIFSVQFILNDKVSEIDRNILINTFYLVGCWGGLGAKARNGFGRFEITGVASSIQNASFQKPDWKILFKHMFKQGRSVFTHPSQAAEVYQTTQNTYGSYQKVMGSFMETYKSAREKLRKKPYDFTQRNLIGSPIPADKRAVFARLSKPYFFTIIPVMQNRQIRYAGYVAYFPSDLPTTLPPPRPHPDLSNVSNVKSVQVSMNTAQAQFNQYLLATGKLKRITL